ncbi:hypothetical protein CDD82_4660 [Ophiocordyceps australis]|uniref:Guanine nucleotide exchange factor synembryn n=1 Tax=Ophiocordyceps australis TaxID=1399860 RepID=A0A2C5Z020_9HYPO|nr:hypothetical protein CDD82_4660 [Ophiocordyceps australis]
MTANDITVMNPSRKGSLTGPAKLQAVSDLVDKLTEDVEKITMLPNERNEALDELKIYGRIPQDAEPIFTRDAMHMLLRHAFFSPSSETARAALRVLANAMLLRAETRQMFVDLGFAPRACYELKKDNWDNELLVSRILFLTTYETDVDLLCLIEKHRLAENLVENLHRHVKAMSNKAKAKADPMEPLALAESLKLLFNVTHFCKEKLACFTPAVPHIAALFLKQDITDCKPLDPPSGPLINALLNLDLSADKSQAALYPKNDATKVASRLVELLAKSLKAYDDNELEAVVTPLISLLSKMYQNAPDTVQQYLRKSLLPTAKDRQGILGRGDTLSSRLLKNSTNPVAPALRDAISELLFDMSDKDASKFVENVGYGFASGFLFQNNVPIPASASEAFCTGDETGDERPVNPVTGQFLDREPQPSEPEMTGEEKQREAERLFVLFERLKKTGVVNVENPVGEAIRQGRFRELGDDEVEEVD